MSCFNKREEEPVLGCDVVSVAECKVQEPLAFKQNCAVCHLFEKNTTGPKLKDVLKRVPSKAWLTAFIQKQDSLIKINDTTTLRIMKWLNLDFNHNYSDLNTKQLTEIIDFITQ